MARHGRPFWEQRVAEVEHGESVDAVARRHRVKPITLRWWRSQLRREQRSAPALLPVVVRDVRPVDTDRVEIVVRNAIVRVPVGADVEYVAALAEAVARRC